MIAGLLRGAAVAHRTGHDHEDDPAGAHVGSAGHLHPRIVSEGLGSGAGSHERGRSLFRPGRQELL